MSFFSVEIFRLLTLLDFISLLRLQQITTFDAFKHKNDMISDTIAMKNYS